VIRFHLDEHVDHAIAHALQSRGIDVTTATDAGLLGAPDEAHLEYALNSGRVIFTRDADFLRLANAGQLHAGIVYAGPGSRSIGDVVRFLCLLHDCFDDAEMKDHVEYM
jgi:hypothetical protein